MSKCVLCLPFHLFFVHVSSQGFALPEKPSCLFLKSHRCSWVGPAFINLLSLVSFKTKISNIVALGISVSTGICRGWGQTDKVYATLPGWTVTLKAPQRGPGKPSLFLWAHAALRKTPTLRRTLHLFWILPHRRPPNCYIQKSQSHFGKLLSYAKYSEMVPGSLILLK